MKLFSTDRVNKAQFDLNYYEDLRKKEIITFTNFYNGRHWSWQRENGEPVTTVNYAAAMVNIGVDFLMGKPFNITSRNEETRQEVCPILNKVWDDNDRKELGHELAKVAGVTGDAWLEVAWDEEEQRIVLTSLDSLMVDIIWNPHRRDQMLQASIRYLAWDKVKDTQETDLYENPMGQHRGDGLQQFWFTKVYTKEKVRIYRDDVKVEEYDNPIGMIPIAHIKNVPTGGFYGESDLKDIISLNREINEKTTEVSDIIGYQGAPITFMFGARADRMQKGANRMVSGLPKDAKVETLQLEGDLPAYQTYIENIKTWMFDVASIPSHAFGEIQPVSNTSGVALQITYFPLVRKIEKKKITFEKGLKRACVIILAFLQVYAGLSLEELEDPNSLEVEFQSMLPKDASLAMQLQLEQLNAGLTDRVSIRMEEFQEDEETATMRIQKADDDKAAQQEAMMAAEFAMNPEAGGIQRGQPLNNTETDTGKGAQNKERREQKNGPDGKGRPRKVS